MHLPKYTPLTRRRADAAGRISDQSTPLYESALRCRICNRWMRDEPGARMITWRCPEGCSTVQRAKT